MDKWNRRILTGIGLVLLAGISFPALAQSPLVIANSEELRGAWVDEGMQIAAFKGIPFATPPVGDMRWRAPLKHTPRQGQQDATQFARACTQTNSGVDWYVRVAETFGHPPEVVGRPVEMVGVGPKRSQTIVRE